MSVPNEWWEDFFNGIVLDFWRLAISEERTRLEADYQFGSHSLFFVGTKT